MFVALVLLGLVLFAVGIRELFVGSGKRALPSRGAAIVITLLGLGSCVAGGVLAPGGETEPEIMRADHTPEDSQCELPAGIVPGSPAAKVHCDLASRPATAEARAELARARSSETLSEAWSGVQAVDLDDCGKLGDRDMMCVAAQMSFIERWPEAWKRDFVSMDEASHCLETGCAGAVVKKPIEACAMKMAIVQSGSPYVGQGDNEDMARLCSTLSPDDREKAAKFAERVLG